MSSKRRVRAQSCTGKRRFATELEARAAIADLVRRKGYDGPMTPYHCKFCHAFHFGHAPRRVRQAIAAKRVRSFA